MIVDCNGYLIYLFIEFRGGRANILVATDVAARGLGNDFVLPLLLEILILGTKSKLFLDVDDVKFVINFDYPNNSEDYIHRIGRTGRSSQKGTSYAFFTNSNSKQAKDLVAVLTEANQRVDPKLAAMAARSFRKLILFICQISQLEYLSYTTSL